MIQALPCFYSYLASIARRAIADSFDKRTFAGIAKNETFKVCVGDYMASAMPVYIESKNRADRALPKHFENRLEKEHTFQDCSALDFSGRYLKYAEFGYSQFRHSKLVNTSLEGSILTGASFYGANLENCRLNNSSIYETDFARATLKNANFANSRGRAGLPDGKKWRHAGFLPTSFRNADLTNADFTGADLAGAPTVAFPVARRPHRRIGY